MDLSRQNRSPAASHVYHGGFGAARTLVLGLARVLSASLPISLAAAAPASFQTTSEDNDGHHPDSGSELGMLFVASAVLVLLGGAFAGLTIALMGQDSIYLQVLSRDETDPQQKNAKRVYELLQRGKHWVLVTLLLSNVIVNETLPVVLDRCLGGGVAAVVGSTVLIVIFGEVLPQSICVRYGLQIGGVMAKPVLALMWLMAPIAWPTAKVLDRALGEDHGTVYKKSGLKTLVTLHRSLGEVSERLNQDEVTIISAVLDLKEKPVSCVMTPMDDVFTMSEDTVLDEQTMDLILSAGYSRIPIHEPGKPTNFVGMLLVKILITYDPEDNQRVSEFPLATLPETRPETSCLDIVNFFQEGKSHMVLVSQYPGEDHGALGVVTLEDVIEELIGEEIIDESDVYIDVHKAIRRLQPAPRARPMRSRSYAAAGEMGSNYSNNINSNNGGVPVNSLSSLGQAAADLDKLQQNMLSSEIGLGLDAKAAHANAPSTTDTGIVPTVLSSSPKATTLMMRRRLSDSEGRVTQSTVPVRANIDDMWQHLRHLGPSNRATNPKNTRSTTVKIKPGAVVPRPGASAGKTAQGMLDERHPEQTISLEGVEEGVEEDAVADDDHDETTHLLAKSKKSSGSARSSLRGYGTEVPAAGAVPAVPAPAAEPVVRIESPVHQTVVVNEAQTETQAETQTEASSVEPAHPSPGSSNSGGGSESVKILSASTEHHNNHRTTMTSMASVRRGIARSGSITESVIETRGIRKVVLQTTSSEDDEEDESRPVAGQLGRGNHRHGSSLHSPVAVASAAVSDVEEGNEAGSSRGAHTDEHDDDEAEPASSQPQQTSSGAAPKRKNRRKKRKPGKS